MYILANMSTYKPVNLRTNIFFAQLSATDSCYY
jgi:hypothetical protein